MLIFLAFSLPIFFPITGTPFQFQLPRGNLLRPVTSITPPPTSPLSDSANGSSMRDGAVSCAMTKPSDGALVTSKGNDGAAVSPSDVRQDFFHSLTPSSTQQQQEARDGQSALSADESCHGSGTSSNVAVQPAPKSTSVTQLSRPGSNHSPRLSLSLKRGQAAGSSARRIILPAVAAAEKKSRHGSFEMGLSPEEQLDSMQAYTSSPPLPQIEVPSDSQFENSDNSELYFKVTKPPSNRSFTSDQEDVDAESGARGSKSLFSDVVTTKRQKVASPHSKSDTLDRSNIPVARARRDPYEYNSQSQDIDVQEVLLERSKRRNSAPKDKGRVDLSAAGGNFEDRAEICDSQVTPPMASNRVPQNPVPAERSGTTLVVSATDVPVGYTSQPADPTPMELGATGTRDVSAPIIQPPIVSSATAKEISAPNASVTHPPNPNLTPTEHGGANSAQTTPDPHPTIPLPTPGAPAISTSANESLVHAGAAGAIHSESVITSLIVNQTGNHANPATTEHRVSKDTTPGTSVMATRTDHAPEPSHLTPMEQSAATTKSTMSGTSPALQPVLPTSRTADRSHLVMNLSADSVPSVRVMHPPALSPHIPYASPVSPRRHLSSPYTSSSEFVSPSRSISTEGLLELRRQVNEQLGREVALCELRYVRTTRTVIEERSICCEMVDNGVVVPGSEKVLQVTKYMYMYIYVYIMCMGSGVCVLLHACIE